MPMLFVRLFSMLFACGCMTLQPVQFALAATPNFTRDIQPIFAKHCSACHGGVKQAGDLSFVSAATVMPPEGSAIEPGKPDESELIRRVESTDPDEQMPPPSENGERLSADEIALLRDWIADGATWAEHWSRTPLVAPEVPEASTQSDWPRSSLDSFVLSDLSARGLMPSPEAPAQQWLRRASLDLIGLPPTVQELEKFLSELAKSPSDEHRSVVYAAEVDRLLGSKRYGERWAAMWMDLARYADSMGFEKDPHRDMWPYRDWVIDAFNEDMPYDEFTVRQLAGDLLPDATYRDLIATGFHRNTQTNTEGGTDDEEYRIAAVIDRLSTTWTVWQGTTFGCVQCHDHPYEPIKNVEFYQCLDYFNQTEDVDLDDEFPRVPYVTDPKQQAEFTRALREISAATQRVQELGKTTVERAEWTSLVPTSIDSSSGQLGQVENEIRVLGGTVAEGSTYTLDFKPLPTAKVTAIRLDILPDSDEPTDWPEQGAVLSQILAATVSNASGEEAVEPLPLEFVDVIVDQRSGPFEPESVFEANRDGVGGYPKLFGPRWAVFVFKEPLEIVDANRFLRLTLSMKASVTGGLSNHLRRFKLSVTSGDELTQLPSQVEYTAASSDLAEAKRALAAIQGTQVPVMRQRELEGRRSTRQFIRGNWLERAEVVEPSIPGMLQPSAIGHRDAELRIDDRLEFARWLVSADNPLAARVWANRVWAQLFGLGIVETLEDFGPSGTLPSHPELLEHLAHRMQFEHRWSLKSFLREVVLSATYRQDSRTSSEQHATDPRNQWLARGPRNRLSAEMLRDQALLVAGVLDDRIGGASVMPPQPEGVWQQVYSGAVWKVAEGADRYRRALYTYWKRTSPYPAFMMFDAPNRDVCSARRVSTNTPLQALVTMNSEAFTELAGLAAEGACRDASDHESAMRLLFVRFTSREPSEQESRVLNELYLSALGQESAAGANEPEEGTTRKAAMSQVALAIMNSDLAMTK